MNYKPDIFSTLGIYRNNKWGFRPTIYCSTVLMMEGKSRVESAGTGKWFYNSSKGVEFPRKAEGASGSYPHNRVGSRRDGGRRDIVQERKHAQTANSSILNRKLNTVDDKKETDVTVLNDVKKAVPVKKEASVKKEYKKSVKSDNASEESASKPVWLQKLEQLKLKSLDEMN